MKNHKYLLPIILLAASSLLLNACSFSFEVLSTPTSAPTVADIFTSTPQTLESTPAQTELASSDSDRLGLCFSYPQGYTQLPNNDAVEIVAPDIAGTGTKGLFWIETSDAYDRTAEVIADQDMTAAGLSSIGRSFVTLDGEEAVVLDGMPGQDFQRRVYVVHDQTLYVLAFMGPLRRRTARCERRLPGGGCAFSRHSRRPGALTMCVGIPMQVIGPAGEGAAWCMGREGRSRIDLALVGPQPAGTWLLTFLGAAREVMTAESAARTDAALDALAAVLDTGRQLHPGRCLRRPGLARAAASRTPAPEDRDFRQRRRGEPPVPNPGEMT